MTGPDYPAAHSMDTLWYAVDDAGHVAALYTGENGPCPADAGRRDALGALADRVLGPGHRDGPFGPTARAAGVFYYRYADGFDADGPVDVYERERAPDRPTHVDQLPPDLRQEWKRFRFPGVRFSEAERLQPLEVFDCSTGNPDEVAYLASDGRTVRPLPGLEEEFPEYVHDWRQMRPDVAARYRFEGVDDGP